MYPLTPRPLCIVWHPSRHDSSDSSSFLCPLAFRFVSDALCSGCGGHDVHVPEWDDVEEG